MRIICNGSGEHAKQIKQIVLAESHARKYLRGVVSEVRIV